ncbi:MAG: GTP-binding protein, partial [Candidatus Paceibacterota bacterium]
LQKVNNINKIYEMFTRIDNTFKVVTLGSSGVGKTSLMVKYVKEIFTPDEASTIGASFLTKKVVLDNGKSIVFEVFDTAGQERYESLAPLYYRSAQVAIIIYDITNRETWDRAKRWIHTIENMPILIVILGNKVDIGEKLREVSTKELQDFVRNTKHIAYVTSALLDSKREINHKKDVNRDIGFDAGFDLDAGLDKNVALAGAVAGSGAVVEKEDKEINKASIETIFLEIAQNLLDQKAISQVIQQSKQIVQIHTDSAFKRVLSSCSLL